MFEIIWWFIFKDSRVGMNILRKNSTQILIFFMVLNLSLSIVFFTKIGNKVEKDWLLKFNFFKFAWEIFNALFVLPYLIYKSYQKYNYDPDNKKDWYNLTLFLQSRILEKALGLTVFGLISLVFGFFNVAWAVANLVNVKNFNRYPSPAREIVYLYVVADVVALVILIGFTLTILTYKIKGVIQGTTNLHRIIKKKIHL